MNVTSLQKVSLAEGIQEIGKKAFYNCISLGKEMKAGNEEVAPLSLPSTLVTINDYAFYNASSLMELSFGSIINLAHIGDYAFGNSALYSMYIPQSIRTIGEGAFINNTYMQSLQFQDSFVQTDSNGNVIKIRR